MASSSYKRDVGRFIDNISAVYLMGLEVSVNSHLIMVLLAACMAFLVVVERRHMYQQVLCRTSSLEFNSV